MSKEKAKKNNNKRNFIANNIYMLKLIARISPARVAATFFNTFAVFFSRLFFVRLCCYLIIKLFYLWLLFYIIRIDLIEKVYYNNCI